MLTSKMRRIGRMMPGHLHDGGQALLFVLIAVALLMSIPVAIATTTVNQLPETTRNLNWDAAYEAAQAGANDYMQDLDVNPNYIQYSKALPNGNAAFSGWVQASTSPLEYYSYTPTVQVGQVLLTVSGKAGTGATAVVRSFSYTIRPTTTLDDVYWSNYETLDTVVTNTEPSPQADQAYCQTYYDEPASDQYPGGTTSGSNYTINGVTIPAIGPPSDCIVQFYTGDVLDGPVFSNDTFSMCGTPEFDSSIESGNPFAPSSVPSPPLPGEGTVWVDSCPASPPTTAPAFDGGPPAQTGNTTPASAVADVTPAKSFGCYYSAPVTISLSLTGAGNTDTQIVVTPVSGSVTVTKNAGNTSTCYTGSSTFSTAQTFDLSAMDTGLIYVNGNANVSGTMTGLLDIVSAGNLTVTNNLQYKSGDINATTGTDSTDALGLIASNSVIVDEVDNMTIDAAILALADSFYVNNWYSQNGGPHGNGYYDTLNVFGAIAQNFRGPVGTSGTSHGQPFVTGFSKDYQYDQSLQSLWPPYFLPPNGAVWAPSGYSELCAGLTYSVMGTKTPGSC
jgi:hypothetical protein